MQERHENPAWNSLPMGFRSQHECSLQYLQTSELVSSERYTELEESRTQHFRGVMGYALEFVLQFSWSFKCVTHVRLRFFAGAISPHAV